MASEFNRSERRSRRQALIDTLRHALRNRGKMPGPREQYVSSCKDRGLQSLSSSFAPTRDGDVLKGVKGDHIYESTDTGTGLLRCVTAATNKEINRRQKRDEGQPDSPGAQNARQRYRAGRGGSKRGNLEAIERLASDFKQVLSANDHITTTKATDPNKEIKCDTMATRDACYQVRYPDTQTQKCYWEADTNQNDEAKFGCAKLTYTNRVRYLDNADTEARRSGRKIDPEDFHQETKPGEKFPAHPDLPSLRLSYRKGGANKAANYKKVETSKITQPDKPAEHEPLYRNPGAGRHLVPLNNASNAAVPVTAPANAQITAEFTAIAKRTALDEQVEANPIAVKRTLVGKETAKAVLAGGARGGDNDDNNGRTTNMSAPGAVRAAVNLLLSGGAAAASARYRPTLSHDEQKCSDALLQMMNLRANALENGVQIPPRIWKKHAWPLLRKLLYFVQDDGEPIESGDDDYEKQRRSVQLITRIADEKHEIKSNFAEEFYTSIKTGGTVPDARYAGLHNLTGGTPYNNYMKDTVLIYGATTAAPSSAAETKTRLGALLKCDDTNMALYGPATATSTSLYHTTNNMAKPLVPTPGAATRATVTQRLMDTLVRAQQTNQDIDHGMQTKIIDDLKKLLPAVGFTGNGSAASPFRQVVSTSGAARGTITFA